MFVHFQDRIKTGSVSWEDSQQFKDWELTVLQKFKKDEPEDDCDNEERKFIEAEDYLEDELELMKVIEKGESLPWTQSCKGQWH